MKKKIKRFWLEWGMTKEELEMFIGAFGVIFTPIVFGILCSIVFSI